MIWNRSEDIRNKVGVTSAVDKTREKILEIVWACEEEIHKCREEV